ncbi:uncharacterized protein NPIL_272241 [Nephila pilipes]|uniref:Peptidase aspartic putative domain-containing protein n=1 Tax=Nephila pilipes TaxID=299642 RepID=A0A8X6UP00_NEPPI|nr:uncharacterized protein NPIL_272241 [Nephila pilipes]
MCIATGRSKTDLPALYDELEAKIRALESFGELRTHARKIRGFLSPLVEPCLPEEVLVAWERSRNHGLTENKESRNLEHLMNFLRQEVKGEEMVRLARTGLTSHQNPRRKEFQNEQLKQSGESSTASTLVSLQKSGKKNCIFCDKSHPSEICYLAKKMTLTAKQKLLLEKGACFSCLKIAGHISKFCNVKNQLKCPKCNNHHFELTCPEPRKNNEPKSFVSKSENSFSNCSRSETVFLQTLCVLIRCQGQEKIIRAVIDSGSQSSYVLRDVLGKLLTENTVALECAAVETKLGWTVFGKGSCRIDNILPSLSMHSMSLPANKLWELEVSGIASENEKEKNDFKLKFFRMEDMR